jgi:tetratricopeptide (TPR) repeat protein
VYRCRRSSYEAERFWRVGATAMMDRRYLVGFIAGSLVGLAFGVPSGHALLRGGGDESPSAVLVPVPPRAVAPHEGSVASLIDEGRQALRNGQPERALATTLQAERLDPNDANVKNNLCAYLGELHRYDEAVAACNAALRLQPGFKLARNNLEWVQAERSKARVPSSSRAP